MKHFENHTKQIAITWTSTNSPYTFLKGPDITNAYEYKSICDCRQYVQSKVEPACSYTAVQGPKTGPLWSTLQECAL